MRPGAGTGHWRRCAGRPDAEEEPAAGRVGRPPAGRRLVGEIGQESCEGFGQPDRSAVEKDYRLAVERAQRVGGQGCDAGGVPAEQEQKRASRADLQGQGPVGEALLEEFPVGVLVESLGAGGGGGSGCIPRIGHLPPHHPRHSSGRPGARGGQRRRSGRRRSGPGAGPGQG